MFILFSIRGDNYLWKLSKGMDNKPDHFYEFEDFRLDAERRLLMRGNSIVTLTPKQFSLLLVLVQNKGKLISSQEIKKAVWPESRAVENKTLSQTVYSLRAQLGDSAKQQRFIENVPRRGYRFASEVRERRGDEPVINNSAESLTQAKVQPLPALIGFRWWVTLALLSLVLIVSTALLFRSAQKPIAEIEITWPKAGAEVSGEEPFKVAVKGMPLNEYRMFWKLGDDRMNLMVDSYEGYPHKMFLVDFSGWTWRGRGPYTVNFVAMGRDDKIIAQKSLEIFVKNQ